MRKLVLALACRNQGTRLYGKPMQNLDVQTKHTILDNIIQIFSDIEQIDEIVLGISEGEANKDFVNYALNKKIKYVIGDQNDVLSRLIQCADHVHASDVIRITSECPFPYVKLFEKCWNLHKDNNNDATFLDEIIDGCGLEIISKKALEISHEQGSSKHRSELCSLFIRENIKNFRVQILKPDNKLIRRDLRLTVDNPEDLVVCREVYNYLKKNNLEKSPDISRVVDFLDSNIHLKKLIEPYCDDGYSTMYINKEKTINTGQSLYKKAKGLIPGGNMFLSKRPEMFLPEKWPSYFSKSKGCFIWDLDGNKYVDMSLMSVGTNILGYGNQEIDDAVYQTIQKGNMSTLNCPEEVELADKLVQLHNWADMAKFARTGGEANAIAIRIARAYSKRDKVAICGYHGWHDWYLSMNIGDKDRLGAHLMTGLEPVGVPISLKDTVFSFNYNNLEELEKILSENDIGVIKMEVIRSSPPNDNFLGKIRKICDEKNIVLIFDECTTGFRETFGGIHKKYGVDPDIAIFGKALGNGYAITAILGKEHIMQASQDTFISSTFWTERIGPTAALKTLEIMEKEKSWDDITNKGKKIINSWDRLAQKHELDIIFNNIPSLASFNINSKDFLKYKTYITQEMMKNGYIASNTIYSCVSHDEKITSNYFEILDPIFKTIKECEDGKNLDDLIDSPICHSGFARLN